MNEYESFLATKRRTAPATGINVATGISPNLFDWQQTATRWALRRGKAALFEDCGLGKTLQQLEWARHVHLFTGRDVLILAPLAVAQQTQREGVKFAIPVTVCRTQADVQPGINITNYEMLHQFTPRHFAGVVLDESSCIKHKDTKTKAAIMEAFGHTHYRLACTATPAPNDYMELGNHAEFLGVMSMSEMLATYFVHDGGDTRQWRLKGHAQEAFWRWLASWGLLIRTPADIGYDAARYVLPPLQVHEHHVEGAHAALVHEGQLMALPAATLDEQRKARRMSMPQRVARCAELVTGNQEPWLLWCDYNDEADALVKAIPGAVQIAGADTLEAKEQRLLGFLDGTIRVLVTKPSIAAWGLNLQHCSHMAFVGMSYSYESYYQAIRRCWRFGQDRPVAVHVIISELESAVLVAIKRKEEQAKTMADGMAAQVGPAMCAILGATERDTIAYQPQVAMQLPAWLEREAA